MHLEIEKTIIIAFVCMIVTSCNKEIKKSESLVFDADKIESPCLFSKAFEEVEYLPLETKDESLLGIIQKMKYSNSRYYFLTGFNEQKFIAFDKKNGKHILTINKNGKGPGEYITAQDFWVDKNNLSIEVYSRGTRKLIIYNKIGNFIRDEKIEYIIRSFIKMKNDYYFEALSEKSKKALFIMRGKNKSVEKLIEIDDYYINDLNNFSQFGDTVSYGCSILDYIIHVKDDDLVEKLYYDFNKFKLTNELLTINETDNDLFIRKLKESEFAFNIFSSYESSNYIVSTIRYNKKMYVMIYSKKSKSVKIFHNAIDDLNGFKNNIEVDMNFMPLCLDGDVIIFKIEALDFKNMLSTASSEKPFSKTQYSNAFQRINSNDNPIIIKCKLKNF